MPGIVDAVIAEKYYLYSQEGLEKEAAWNPVGKWFDEAKARTQGYNQTMADEALHGNLKTEGQWDEFTNKAKQDFKIHSTPRENLREIYNLGKEDLKNYFKNIDPNQFASMAGAKLADGVAYAGKHGYHLGKEFGKSFLNTHGGTAANLISAQPWISDGFKAGVKTLQKERPLLTGALAAAVPLLALYAGKKGVSRLIRKRASEIYENESYGFYK